MSVCAQTHFVRMWPEFPAHPARHFITLSQPVNEPEIQDDDIELLRRIADGNRGAFAEFYDRHATLMFSVASKILNDAGEAEDVLQEAFVQIWEKAGRFDPKLGKAASWAAILVRNKAIDRIRASQRRTRLAEKPAWRTRHRAEVVSDSANENFYGHDKAKFIHSAIVELPEEQRRRLNWPIFPA
jgi:RNA polymerase sigma-70 factor (ECF subfamily)